MARLLFSAAFAVCLAVTPAIAQRGGHNGFPVLAPSAPQHGGFGPRNGHHRPNPSGFFLGTPFWGDDFYFNDPTSPDYVIEMPAQKPRPLEYPKSLAPVVIELHGDRYVRRSVDDANGESQQEPVTTVASSTTPRIPRTTPARASVTALPSRPVEQAPTVFVFRDGHREESSDYSIISGVIYSRGDYWTTGSWSKKILIADLDVPATIEANRERSVSFRLPNAPNEIITRP
jgi:hypothetical protein